MISPFLFNGVDDQNAATSLLLREKAALLSIHAEAQATATMAAQQAALLAQHQHQQNAQQQQSNGQSNNQQQTNQSGQAALVNTMNNNSFALQSNLLANGSANSIALNNLNNLSAMSNSNNLASLAAVAASSLCNTNSPTQSNKMLWRAHPAFQQEVYNLLAALPWYSALGNFKAPTANATSTDQQMAALHQFWSQTQNQLNNSSNQLSLNNTNSLSEHSSTANSLNSGPIRPTIHSAESILQTMNRYTPYSFKKELQGDCN